MMSLKINSVACILSVIFSTSVLAQKNTITFIRNSKSKKIDILADGKPFTSFLYNNELEKPVLFPVFSSGKAEVTRGFPLSPKPGDPIDHPHHIGIWFNFENVNGLDFWNNSYAIPSEKKKQYGWIRTNEILKMANGPEGELIYRASWTNQAKESLMLEETSLKFTSSGTIRTITRTTTLTANIEVTFTDAKDGMLGIRLAHELQIPTEKDQKFTDDKGIVTIVKGGTDRMANGTYLTSENKTGDEAWSTRARWCVAYGKINGENVSVAIIDHPKNINYPTFWHARGYGLFAANPLGENVFTNGKSAKNLKLRKGESVTFNYRIVIADGAIPPLNQMADEFAKQ